MHGDRVDRVVEAKRELHAELRRPVTFEGLLTVCAREGIRIRRGPLPAAGMTICFGDCRIIALDSRRHPRRETYVLAHELGHVWLHAEEEPIVYHMEEPWPDDPREDEAEYCALRLLQGW